MGLIEDCYTCFKTRDLYEVLQAERRCTDDELKKAYRRMSLYVHPDRVEAQEIENATRSFQVLGKAYAVLSDKDRRIIYDETGEVDDEYVEKEGDWCEYWRQVFPKLTVEDINNFMRDYKGSKEQRSDLKKLYLECEGNMNKICDGMLGFTYTDEDFYMNIIREMIEKGEVPDFPAFTKESAAKRKNRRKKYEREAAEAEDVLREAFSTDELALTLARRSQSRENNFNKMIADMESRYCKKPRKPPTKGKKGKK